MALRTASEGGGNNGIKSKKARKGKGRRAPERKSRIMGKALRRKAQCFSRKSRLKRRRAQNIIYHKSPNACGQAQNNFTFHSKNKNINNELYKTRNKTRYSLNSMQTRPDCFTWNLKGASLLLGKSASVRRPVCVRLVSRGTSLLYRRYD